MKILIVSNCPTHPVNAGNRKAILNQVEIFKKFEHEIYFLYVKETALLSFNTRNDKYLSNYWKDNLFIYDVSKIEHARQLFVKRLRYVFSGNYSHVDDYYPIGLSRYINKLHLEYNFDCCIVNYYWLSKVLKQISIPLKGLYTHDYFAYKDILVKNRSVPYCTNAHQEALAMQRSPHIFALNSEEAVYFKKLSPLSVIYNVYSHYDYYKSDVIGNNSILFFSGENIYNLHGINWFISDIFPKLLTANPDIKLVIGGGICKVLDIKHPNIEYIGYVEDPRDFYKLGDIVINPTYEGTGLKIKTFEALSYDKVVIAHPHSIEGIFNKYNSPVYTSDNPELWVGFITSLVGNIEYIKEIKSKNQEYIKEMNAFVEKEYRRFFSNK